LVFQTILTGAAKQAFEAGVTSTIKTTREASVSILGYDFLGLIGRLLAFFVVAFLINSYFQAVIVGGSWLNTFAGFFNLKFPTTLPDSIVKLFTVGYKGVTFWQVVQVIAILLIIVEAMQYEKMLKSNKTLEYPNGQKANVSTLAVFSILALSLSLMTFPQIIQKAQEMRIVNG